MDFERANGITLDQILYGTFAVQNPDLVENLRNKRIYTLGDMIRNRIKIRSLRNHEYATAVDAVYMSGYCFISKHDDKNFSSPDELADYSLYERWIEQKKKETANVVDILLRRLGVAHIKGASSISDILVESVVFAPDDPNYHQTSRRSLEIGEWLQYAHWEKMDETAEEEA